MSKSKFKTGLDVIDEENKPRSSFVRNYEWFRLEEDSQMIVRFITEGDEIISVKTHQSIPTKDAPDGYTGKWPKSLPAACRYDSAFEGIHNDCFVCDFKILSPWTQKPITASRRYWALAVVREEIREGGVLKGYRDTYVERPEYVDGQETGKTIKMLRVVVINQGAKNFFAQLQGIFGMTGTITDRDYAIRRSGSMKDTAYTIFPMPEERDSKGRAYSAKNTPEWWDEHYLKPIAGMGVDLEKIVEEQASDDRYGRFFDPRVNGAGRKVEVDVPSPRESEEMFSDTSSDIDPSDLGAMAARVRGYRKN